ncbi:MAG TPA: polymer-forming cytoskeletal protein [Chitinophagaceae bacterium]|nr:polymer-forming cytoskeletal protein [Chitinophagaceae bacterium]
MRVRWPLYNVPFIKTDFLISADTVLQGPLQASCGGCVDGLVKGYISIAGNIIIGAKAEIIGDITAKAAKVFGRVHGNITCEDIVIVHNSAHVKGDIKAKIIEVKEGAHVEGVIIKLGEENEINRNTQDDLAESAEATELVIEPVRSTDKDKDATAWF